MKTILKLAVKDSMKSPFFFFLNVLGFAIAISVGLITLQYSKEELSVDHAFTQKKRSYRLLRSVEDAKSTFRATTFSSPFREALQLDLGESVEEIIRVYRSDELVVHEDHSFLEENFLYVDPGFFKIFDFPFIAGDKETALSNPKSIVLSSEVARKYFANEDPIGKVLDIDGALQLTVTGVVETMHHPSHLEFGLIAPIQLMDRFPFMKQWNAYTLNLYLLSAHEVDKKNFASKLNLLTNKYFSTANYNSIKTTFLLQSFEDIYFDNDLNFDSVKHGDKKTVYGFLFLGIVIIAIASANFINLTTAVYNNKAKEIAIRKVLGASRGNLIKMSLAQSFFTISISVILGYILSDLLTEVVFNVFEVTINYHLNIDTVIYLFLLIISLTILCGIYPGLMVSSFRPIEAFRGRLKTGTSALFSRRLLLGFQFFASIILVFLSLVMHRQFTFMHQKKLGFDSENVLVFHSNNSDIYRNKDKIKSLLQTLPEVESTSIMYGGVPGGAHPVFSCKSKSENSEYQWNAALVDEDFIKVLNLKILSGRGFSHNLKSDYQLSVMINKSAAKILGWGPEDAVGKSIELLDDELASSREIIGVVEDYHFQSLKSGIQPLMLIPDPGWGESFVVKLTGSDLSGSIKKIANIWAGLATKYPFTYQFLNLSFSQLYQEQLNHRNLFTILAILSFLISSLGIIGLGMFYIVQRTREIAIRKVLGASFSNIFTLLAKEFLILIAIANLIAYPISFRIASIWLSEFAFRTSISLWHFLMASFLLLVAIMSLVMIQSLKANLINPVNNLKAN